MAVDWDLTSKLVGPVLGALVGAAIKHVLDSRPKVVAFLGHVSGITLQREGNPLIVGSHSVVIRNAGRKAASSVRVGHSILPDFQVFPDTPYIVETLPNGSREIRFPQLVPKKQVTITYLYFPPITWQQVNTYLETDDGPIRVLNVLPTVQVSRGTQAVLWTLVGTGVVAVLYLLALLGRWIADA